MELISTEFDGVYKVKFFSIGDNRGRFIKPFVQKSLNEVFGNNVETYFSWSEAGSFRGLHYQEGKYAQDKLVICLQGKIIDFAIDLRKSSKTYKKTFSMKLDSNENYAVLIPKGFAHGIYAIEKCLITNFCSTQYAPDFEKGIHWQSVDGYENINVTELSEKDAKLPKLDALKWKIS